MIGTTGSKWGTREKSRTSAKGASVERVHRKVSFNGIHSVFSVPLVPFERANRSAGKKRNEFRSTTPRLRGLGKGQNWLMVDHLRRCGLRDQRRRDHVAELTGARRAGALTIEPPPVSAGGRRSCRGSPQRPPSHRGQEEVVQGER